MLVTFSHNIPPPHDLHDYWMDFFENFTKMLPMHSTPEKWPEISVTDPRWAYGGRNFCETKIFWSFFAKKMTKSPVTQKGGVIGGG